MLTKLLFYQIFLAHRACEALVADSLLVRHGDILDEVWRAADGTFSCFLRLLRCVLVPE